VPENEFLVLAARAVFQNGDAKSVAVRRHLNDISFDDRHLNFK
jgi:hypothetical protein